MSTLTVLDSYTVLRGWGGGQDEEKYMQIKENAYIKESFENMYFYIFPSCESMI